MNRTSTEISSYVSRKNRKGAAGEGGGAGVNVLSGNTPTRSQIGQKMTTCEPKKVQKIIIFTKVLIIGTEYNMNGHTDIKKITAYCLRMFRSPNFVVGK